MVLRIELPTPFPVGNVNLYFIDGDEPTLVDTGVYSSRSLNALRDQLQAHGRRLEDVRRILITHDHLDHAGAALHLSQELGAKLYLRANSTLMSRWEPEPNRMLSEFVVRCGVPRHLVEQASALFGRLRHFDSVVATSVPIEWLQGGESIDCGDVSLEALATPGHSPDHLCFRDNANRTLFCGDMLLGHITPNPILNLDPQHGYRRTHSLLDYLDSLDRLAKLPCARGLPGHGQAIDDVANLIANNRTFIDRRKLQFRDQIARGATVPYTLAQAVFGELDMGNQFLAISETVAYLDLLEHEGLLAVDWEGAPITAVGMPA